VKDRGGNGDTSSSSFSKNGVECLKIALTSSFVFLLFSQSFDRTSTPLKPRAGAEDLKDAKFVEKPQVKFSGTEKDNMFIQFEIFGDPVPKIEWYKVTNYVV
jgi:hypothetical protein